MQKSMHTASGSLDTATSRLSSSSDTAPDPPSNAATASNGVCAVPGQPSGLLQQSAGVARRHHRGSADDPCCLKRPWTLVFVDPSLHHDCQLKPKHYRRLLPRPKCEDQAYHPSCTEQSLGKIIRATDTGLDIQYFPVCCDFTSLIYTLTQLSDKLVCHIVKFSDYRGDRVTNETRGGSTPGGRLRAKPEATLHAPNCTTARIKQANLDYRTQNEGGGGHSPINGSSKAHHQFEAVASTYNKLNMHVLSYPRVTYALLVL